MTFFEPDSRDKALFPWDPFKGVVVPRPIGWISSMSKAGKVNLAPYSFFNGVQSHPRIVSFCSETEKDAAAFAIESGEFAWSMATWDLRDKMNATSAGLPRGQSEFEFAGLATAPCRLVRAPRVADSPAAMECRVTQVVRVLDVDGRETGGVVVYGQVIGMHIDERCMKRRPLRPGGGQADRALRLRRIHRGRARVRDDAPRGRGQRGGRRLASIGSGNGRDTQ